MFYTKLSRSLIRLTGGDTIDLLQGIISNDARALAAGQPVYAAMLTPQGKFLHDFLLLPIAGGALLDIAATRAADITQRLKMYRLRSNVDITPVADAVFTVWAGELPQAPDNLVAVHDPRLPALGWRVAGEEGAVAAWLQSLGAAHADEDAYTRHRLELSVPDTADMIVDKSLLLELGFEELNGVNFTKGCYVGQEVTARSKYRANLRKSLYAVSGEALGAAGTEVMAGERVIGELRTSSGGIGLALLNIEEVEKAKAANMPLLAGGVAIEAALPGWMAPHSA